ncbi:hypothetical protein [Halomonas sp. NO4]|uniref:hypothetical protein n=1 Tax=Halomonas sp. NO4 TaxID=2484813 RepID=UPI00196A0277|nr:hypothetical protein [Halomonas sp. NO4]
MIPPRDSNDAFTSRATLSASLEHEDLAKAANHSELEQLLAECDPEAPEMEAVRAWQATPAVGREVV